MRLKCPNCKNDVFNIHTPTSITDHFLRFDYITCAKCSKLWTIKPNKDEPLTFHLKEGIVK